MIVVCVCVCECVAEDMLREARATGALVFALFVRLCVCLGDRGSTEHSLQQMRCRKTTRRSHTRTYMRAQNQTCREEIKEYRK